MALKNFKEDGFDVTLYESRSWIGGLWKYSDDDALSTAENTVFNSSKYRTAMSDFPIPDEMADYPPAEELLNYLESYCTHFELWPHIKTSSPVRRVQRQDDGWVLEIGEESHSETFDKVAFSCGPFVKPRKPHFEGIEQFEGHTVHAMHFHKPSQFKGQRILIVGLHASGMDVALSLAGHASQVYMTHRSGVLMVRVAF
jgi:dimethylaniline monooxygenase (N-oxide forming)